MKFYIRKDDSKTSWFFNSEKPVLDSAEDEFEGPYYLRVDLGVYLDDDNKIKIAEVALYYFNMRKIEYDGEDLVDVADSIDQEVYDAIGVVATKDLLPKEVWDRPILCYLDTLYVMPEFRGKGIGSWLIKNLEELLRFYYGAVIHGVVTYPRPSDGHTADEKMDDIIKTDSMYQRMVDLLTKNDYLKIGETNYFFKKCEEEID